MDDHPHANGHAHSSSWPCFWEIGTQQQDEDLKQALIRTTLELESTRLTAQEELSKLEAQSLHLAHLLQIATRERDESRRLLHLLLLSQNPNPNPEQSSTAAAPPPPSPPSEEEESSKVSSPAAEEAAPLPERGRLVEAVMRAGPLLQTLMLAGPLPRWQHPPPAMKSFEIPPVEIGGASPGEEGKKRMREDSSSPESDCRRQQRFGSFRA